MHSKFLVLILFVLFLKGLLTAQQPFSINYQAKEGLFSNYIYFVYLDSKGYIWVGSDIGVSRFDGNSFTHFNTAHGLSDNEVFSMLEDRKGRLWFATLNGKPCFYQNGTIYSEKNLPLLKQCDVGGLVLRIFEQQNGNLNFCSTQKIRSVNLDAGRCEEISFPMGLYDAWENQDGTIGCIGNQSLQVIEKSGVVSSMYMPLIPPPIRALLLGDTILISSSNQVLICERQTGRIIQTLSLLEAGSEIIDLRMNNGQIWLGTRKGSFSFDYPSFRPLQRYLPGRSVTSMLEDREGGRWFSTLEEGLFYIPAPDILHFTTAEGLVYNRIICLSRDASGRLWIGSEGSTFSIFDGKVMRTRQILKETVKNKNILNIRHLPDHGTLVVGKSGTLILRNGTERFLYQRAADINIDRQGDYWVGLAGLYRIKKAQIPHKIFPPERLSQAAGYQLYSIAPAQRLSDLRVEKIEFDQQNRIWLATSTGLYTGIDSTQYKCVLPYVTRDILFDSSRQVLWALSESKGLFAIQNGRVTDSIPIVNSRGGVICRDFCLDSEGNLWIGSAGGLFEVTGEPGRLQLTNYWGVYGLGGEKINAVEVIDDQIFIGKDDGLLRIPKNILRYSVPSPPVWIKSVQINNKTRPFTGQERIEMKYGEGSVYVEFEGLSFREVQNIRYRYRLRGLDDNWRETGNEAIEFAALRPGHYILEVFSINGSGVPCARPAVLKLQVLPPFWMRAWFLLLVAGGLAAAGIAYIRWREKRLRSAYEVKRRLTESSRLNAELQQKNTELRMLALRLQMNPHFIFNALNTIKGYYGQEKVVEANAFIGRFARLLRLNLDYSDAMIPLEYEIELLQIYLQLSQTRYPGKIGLEIFVDPALQRTNILIPSMLVQPFVENAVIHGLVPKAGSGQVFIGFYKNDGEIRVCIKDDGIGRAASGKLQLRNMQKPLATQITTDRLRLLRPGQQEPPVTIRDLYDSNGAAAGTEVILLIPFQNNHSHDQRDNN